MRSLFYTLPAAGELLLPRSSFILPMLFVSFAVASWCEPTWSVRTIAAMSGSRFGTVSKQSAHTSAHVPPVRAYVPSGTYHLLMVAEHW